MAKITMEDNAWNAHTLGATKAGAAGVGHGNSHVPPAERRRSLVRHTICRCALFHRRPWLCAKASPGSGATVGHDKCSKFDSTRPTGNLGVGGTISSTKGCPSIRPSPPDEVCPARAPLRDRTGASRKSDHYPHSQVKLVAEVEDLFGPLVAEPRFHDAVRRNISRRSALLARDSPGTPAGGRQAPRTGGDRAVSSPPVTLRGIWGG